jgi:hypothetical protein
MSETKIIEKRRQSDAVVELTNKKEINIELDRYELTRGVDLKFEDYLLQIRRGSDDTKKAAIEERIFKWLIFDDTIDFRKRTKAISLIKRIVGQSPGERGERENVLRNAAAALDVRADALNRESIRLRGTLK